MPQAGKSLPEPPCQELDMSDDWSLLRGEEKRKRGRERGKKLTHDYLLRNASLLRLDHHQIGGGREGRVTVTEAVPETHV